MSLCLSRLCGMGNSEVFRELSKLVESREWDQFHTPENLAKSIAIEAGELLEVFQWSDQADLERVSDELADVLTYCYLLSKKLGLSPEEIVLEKLAITDKKYPISKARGKSTKYDAL